MTLRLIGLLAFLVGVFVVAWFQRSRPSDVVEASLVREQGQAVVTSPAAVVDIEGAEQLVPPSSSGGEPTQESLTASEPIAASDTLLVHGRVFDPVGMPARGATVDLHATRIMRREGGAATIHFSATADAEGRYEIRSSIAVKDATLQAWLGGFAASALTELPALGAEVDLTLAASSSVSGVVLAGSDVKWSSLNVSLTLTGTPTRPPSTVFSGRSVDATGAYTFEDLMPGEYTVGVRSKASLSWDRLASTPALDVGVGVSLIAPPIDLVATLKTFRIDVTDEFGMAIPKGRGTFWSPSNSIATDIGVRDGVAVIQTRHDTVTAWFGAPGRRTVEVPALSGDARVELGPAHRVRVRLADPNNIQREPYVLWIMVRSRLASSNWVLGQLTRVPHVPFDAFGEATLETAVTGSLLYDLHISDSRMNAVDSPVREPVKQSTFDIVVEERVGEQVIEIDIDPKALSAALERLRQ